MSKMGDIYIQSLLFSVPGEKYEQAIECAKTYLLFHPEDEVMVQNLAYYSTVLGEDKAANISAREVHTTHHPDARAFLSFTAKRTLNTVNTSHSIRMFSRRKLRNK